MNPTAEVFLAQVDEVSLRFKEMNLRGYGNSAPRPLVDVEQNGSSQQDPTNPWPEDAEKPKQSNEDNVDEGQVVAPTEEDIARAREHYAKVPQQILGAANGLVSSTWAFEAPVYQYEEADGDIVPRNEELEQILFRESTLSSAGAHLNNLNDFTVKVVGEDYTVKKLQDGFNDPKIHPVLRETIRLCNYDSPTPIQIYTIPAVLSDRDVFAVAQAGSGKTGAYLIPIISKLCSKYASMAAPRPGLGLPVDTSVIAEPLVIVVSPTRELAIQIFDHCRRLCYRTKLRPCVVYGGGAMNSQREQLQKGCDILIGTPGRMGDFIRRGNASTRRAKYLVLDEADELVESSWDDSMNTIMGGAGSSNRRVLMFSATFSLQARAAAARYLESDHVRITVGRVGSSHRNIRQNIMWIDEHQKVKALVDLLMSLPASRVMIFCNTVATVEAVDDELFQYRLPVTSIHSNRTQREREDALRAFQSSTSPILVTTDVCARGIDVKNVMHIVNFDLPTMDRGGLSEYVNRIGRTGRIGNQGVATSFFNSKNDEFGYELAKLLLECGQPLPDFMESFRPSDTERMFEDEDENRKNKDDDDVEFSRSDIGVHEIGSSTYIQSSLTDTATARTALGPRKNSKKLVLSRGRRQVRFSTIPTDMDLQLVTHNSDNDMDTTHVIAEIRSFVPIRDTGLLNGSNVVVPALDGDYFQQNPESLDQEKVVQMPMTEHSISRAGQESVHHGVMWIGGEFVPIPAGVVGRLPRYNITCHPNAGLSTIKKETEEPTLVKPEMRKSDRRRKTPLPDMEPASEARFVTKDFLTTKDYALPHFFIMPPGAVLKAPLTVPGLTFIKSGFTFPPGFKFTAGASLQISTVIPAGTLIPAGARVSSDITIPGSQDLLATSPFPSPSLAEEEIDRKAEYSSSDLSEMDAKRAMLDKLRRLSARSSAHDAPNSVSSFALPLASEIGPNIPRWALEQTEKHKLRLKAAAHRLRMGSIHSDGYESDPLSYLGGFYIPPSH